MGLSQCVLLMLALRWGTFASGLRAAGMAWPARASLESFGGRTRLLRPHATDGGAEGPPSQASAWHGILAVDKPLGWSSAEVVRAVKSALERHCGGRRAKIKVGHGGTLDPLATGVLVVGVGDGCKSMKGYLEGAKAYEAIGQLGSETDTLDSEGEVVRRRPCAHVEEATVSAALASFRGDIKQVPPVYSALKKDGEALYVRARRGEDVEHLLEPRDVTVYALEMLEFGDRASCPALFDRPRVTRVNDANLREGDWLCSACGAHNFAKREACFKCKAARPTEEEAAAAAAVEEEREALREAALLPEDGEEPRAFKLRMECSGGFYVRSLVRDVARHCDSAATMTSLRRLRQGQFTVEDCLALGGGGGGGGGRRWRRARGADAGAALAQPAPAAVIHFYNAKSF